MKRVKTHAPSVGFVPVGSSFIKSAEQSAYKEIGHEAHPFYNTNQPDAKLKSSNTVLKGK